MVSTCSPDLCDLNFPSGTKKEEECTLSYQLAQVWGKRGREQWSLKVVSCQTSEVEPGSLLQLSFVLRLVCLAHHLSNDKIYFLGDRVCFRLVEYNNYYLHSKIKFFSDP